MGNKVFVVAVTLLFAVWRCLVTPRLDLPTHTGFHEAMAHIWVGMLVGAGWVIGFLSAMNSVSIRTGRNSEVGAWLNRNGFWWFLTTIGCVSFVSLFELVMFLVQKFRQS